MPLGIKPNVKLHVKQVSDADVGYFDLLPGGPSDLTLLFARRRTFKIENFSQNETNCLGNNDILERGYWVRSII